jgi:hypothetical protein
MKKHLQTGKDSASNKNCIEALSVEKYQIPYRCHSSWHRSASIAAEVASFALARL